jgi:hypothetical protein
MLIERLAEVNTNPACADAEAESAAATSEIVSNGDFFMVFPFLDFSSGQHAVGASGT